MRRGPIVLVVSMAVASAAFLGCDHNDRSGSDRYGGNSQGISADGNSGAANGTNAGIRDGTGTGTGTGNTGPGTGSAGTR